MWYLQDQQTRRCREKKRKKEPLQWDDHLLWRTHFTSARTTCSDTYTIVSESALLAKWTVISQRPHLRALLRISSSIGARCGKRFDSLCFGRNQSTRTSEQQHRLVTFFPPETKIYVTTPSSSTAYLTSHALRRVS